MPQFFVPPGSKAGDQVLLSPSDSHHIKAVFRMKTGETLRLTDGAGNLFEGTLGPDSGQGASVTLIRKIPEGKATTPLTLAAALLKKDAMELVIQKAAELGVATLQPMTTSRTIVKTGALDKLPRWQKIADEAAKQCGRPERLQIQAIRPLTGIVKDAAEKILFWEKGGMSLHEYFGTRKSEAGSSGLLMIIGPEGGFSEDEAELARASGCHLLSLGRNILRAETAALAATALVQYELGNF